MDYWVGMTVFILVFGYYVAKYFLRSVSNHIED